MPPELTSVAVLGAGSLRCAPAMLAALLTRTWAIGGTLTLSDEHDEALDLFDRLARVIASYQELEIEISSTSNAREAAVGASTVLLCFGLGQRKGELEQWIERNPKADPQLARCVMLHPYFERINEWLHQDQPQNVINLVAPVELTGKLLAYRAVHVDWPTPLEAARRVPTAHQVLRWVRGDEPAFEPLRLAVGSLIADALDGSMVAEDRFDASALASWHLKLQVGG